MQLTPLPEDSALLEEARRIYRAIRTLPLHVAAALMQQGYIVEQLERQWDRENS